MFNINYGVFSFYKTVLVPLVLTAAAATDLTIHQKRFGSGSIALIISNEEINDIMENS